MSPVRFLLVASLLFSITLVGCGGIAEHAPPGAEGSVTVVWSAVDRGSYASAYFRADGDAEASCTKQVIGACTQWACDHDATPSRSAGIIRVRGSAPLLSLDLKPSEYIAFDHADVRGLGPRPSTSAGSTLVVASDGSQVVPAFRAELPYPERVVLTSPAAQEIVRGHPTRVAVLSRSTSTTLRWHGGSPDARVHIEGTVESTESSWRWVSCDASAASGELEIPAGLFTTDRVSSDPVRALTSIERKITSSGWPITIRIATELLVSDESGGYYAVDLL